MNVPTDAMTAEELAVLKSDVAQMTGDSEIAKTATYHSLGSTSAEDFDPETGVVSETGANIASVGVVPIKPSTEEMEELNVAKADEIYLVDAADLSTITPKPADYMTISSVRKEIKAVSLPIPYAHYRFLTADVGNV